MGLSYDLSPEEAPGKPAGRGMVELAFGLQGHGARITFPLTERGKNLSLLKVAYLAYLNVDPIEELPAAVARDWKHLAEVRQILDEAEANGELVVEWI
jgi:hypothetical protein